MGGARGLKRGSLRKGAFSKQAPVAKEKDEFLESVTTKEKRHLYIKGFVQLITFIVFLSIFTTHAVMAQNAEQIRMTQRVSHHFSEGPMPLGSVRDIKRYWSYLETTFMDAIFGTDGDILVARDALPGVTLPLDMYNRVVGSMRLWQVRVESKTGCQMGTLFENYHTNCFEDLSELTQERKPFGPDGRYTFNEESNGWWSTGALGYYPSSGYPVQISQNETHTKLLIAQLKNDEWIGSATRAVFLDFTVWNSNTNLHSIVRISSEFSLSGTAESNIRVVTVQYRTLYPGGADVEDIVAIVLLVLLCLFIIFYVAEELTEFSVGWRKYFLDAWNIMDWTNLFLLIFAMAFRVMVILHITKTDLGKAELEDADHYTPMQRVADLLDQARIFNAFNAVFMWAKCIKYIGFIPYVKTVIVTLERCLYQYVCFLIMFSVSFIAFVIAYTVGLGESVRELSSVGSTAVYLCKSFLGDMDLSAVSTEAPIFGSALILVYILFIYFLSLNVFFAILVHSLDETREIKIQDFRQEMLLESVAQIKASLKNAFSVEGKLRKYAPGLWAQLYRKQRLKRRQQEKERKRQEAEGKAKGGGGMRMLDWPDKRSNNSGSDAEMDEVDKQDILGAVQLLAGKVLGHIQTAQIELTTHVRDLQEWTSKLLCFLEGYTPPGSRRNITGAIDKLERIRLQQIRIMDRA